MKDSPGNLFNSLVYYFQPIYKKLFLHNPSKEEINQYQHKVNRLITLPYDFQNVVKFIIYTYWYLLLQYLNNDDIIYLIPNKGVNVNNDINTIKQFREAFHTLSPLNVSILYSTQYKDIKIKNITVKNCPTVLSNIIRKLIFSLPDEYLDVDVDININYKQALKNIEYDIYYELIKDKNIVASLLVR